MKYDNGKAPIHLVPSEAIISIAKVLGFGAEKYGENNWREDVDSTTWGRTYSSLQRHLNSFWSGEDLDPESGLPHLDHALCQLMILKIQTLETTNMEMDNRFKRLSPDEIYNNSFKRGAE
jgi:hypothetical protein